MTSACHRSFFCIVLILLIGISLTIFTLEMLDRILIPTLDSTYLVVYGNSTAADQLNLAALPMNLTMDGSSLNVGTSVTCWMLGSGTLLISLCIWAHGEQAPRFLTYFFIPSQIAFPILSLTSLFTTLTIHLKSSHFYPDYLNYSSPGLYGTYGIAEGTVFDFETWTCELANFQSLRNGAAQFRGPCARSVIIRWALVPFAALSFVFLVMSVWVAWGEGKEGDASEPQTRSSDLLTFQAPEAGFMKAAVGDEHGFRPESLTV